MAFKATYLGSNGWIVELKTSKIIIDPWLKCDLVFPLGEWFFKGTLKDEIPTPKNINIILIIQGLPDHCHVPSLRQLPKDVRVICPESARKILEDLGFTTIESMNPKDKIEIDGLSIEATSGAPVPKIENGYIIESKSGSFYIEPHGFFDKSIKPRKLDAVITPTKNLGLPLVGPFVKGVDVLPMLVNAFEPKYILSSTVGGDAKFSGFLNNFISINEFKEEIICQMIDLKSMETFNL